MFIELCKIAKGLFGFSVSITHNSVSITHNSKMVGSMAEKFVWIFITLFPVFVSIIQFSDFWVMSYGNWKHILGVFSFHNSVSNDILVIKHTWRDPPVKVSRNFWPFFFLSFFLLHCSSDHSSSFFCSSSQWPTVAPIPQSPSISLSLSLTLWTQTISLKSYLTFSSNLDPHGWIWASSPSHHGRKVSSHTSFPLSKPTIPHYHCHTFMVESFKAYTTTEVVHLSTSIFCFILLFYFYFYFCSCL